MLVKQSREVERVERKLSAAMGASPRDAAAAIEALEEAIALARVDRAAAEWFVPSELLGELADEYESVGRVDDALAAIRRAIAEGWGGRPDGRCRLAEILLRAGRTAEAAAIWAEVRAATPDDPWLHSAAGIAYAESGDHATALAWLSDGLSLVLRTGDPDALADQLVEYRRECLAAAGHPPDDLQVWAETFGGSVPEPGRPAGVQPDGSVTRGRDTVCWCGSGSKYRKCHGAA